MIKDISPTQRGIRDKDETQRGVDLKEVAQALGAEEVYRGPRLVGAPHVLYLLREDLMRRLSSKGGRPALEGAGKRRKIPFTEDDWGTLDRIARHLSESGRSVTTGQVASAIIHEKLEQLTPTTPLQAVGGVEGLGEHLVRAQRILLANYEVLDVKGIVEWARRFPDLERVWVIVPNFLDDTNRDVLDEVVYNIKERDVQFTYFVRAVDQRRGGRFSKFFNTCLSPLVGDKARSHVISVPLDDKDLLWLQTDFVIANPHRQQEAVGFQYIRRANKPTLAFRMEDYELGEMTAKLTAWASNKSSQFKLVYLAHSTNE